MSRPKSSKNKIKPTPVRTSHKAQTLRGFRDILPDQQKYWHFILEKVKNMAADFSYQKIETPILESVALFERTVGDDSDIVSKEMFAFEDKGGEKVTLRPEITAPICRAYIEHGMVAWPQPVKLWYEGPVFRYDKPQAGRYRQFNQFGFEVLGSDSPEIDAQLLIMADNLYKSFGLNIEIQINSIGCGNCRKDYLKKLTNFLKSKKLCHDCQRRLETNPLRVLDCKEKKCHEAIEEAPQIIDSLCEDCKNHFVKVLEGLDEAGVIYNLNPFLVRGLDYYNRTTFEFYLKGEEVASQNALGGGGRYDYLVEQIGGRPAPAAGFAGGLERIILKIKEANIEIKDEEHGEVFVAQLGPEAKKKCSQLFNALRKEGVKVRQAFAKKGLAAQMEEANRQHVRYTLIVGQKEILDSTAIIRDMDSGIQEIVDFEKSVAEVKNKLLDINNDVKVYMENGHEEKK